MPRSAFARSPLQRFDVSPPLFLLECGDVVAECAALDTRPQAAHYVLIIVEIVPGEQHRAQNLLAANEVMQVGTAVVRARRAGAMLVDRPRIVAMTGVAQVEFAAPGKRLCRT